MSTNTKAVSPASVARLIGLNGADLIEEIPALSMELDAAAAQLHAAITASEDASANLARLLSEHGISAGDLFAKDAEQRYRSAGLAACRDAHIDVDDASRVLEYARDSFRRSYADALLDADVLAALGAKYDAIGQRIDDLAGQIEALKTSTSQLDGAISVGLRDVLRQAGDASAVISHDIQRDAPERIAARARSRARTLIELSDR